MLRAGRTGIVRVDIVPSGAGTALLGREADFAVDVDLVADLAEDFVADRAEVHLTVAGRATICGGAGLAADVTLLADLATRVVVLSHKARASCKAEQ